jgi:hypothetical protein
MGDVVSAQYPEVSAVLRNALGQMILLAQNVSLDKHAEIFQPDSLSNVMPSISIAALMWALETLPKQCSYALVSYSYTRAR